MNAAVKAPLCKCGARAKHIEMLTFSYFFCQACKIEVGGKAAPEPQTEPVPEKWNWATDPGVRAYLNSSPAAPSAPPAGSLRAAYPPPGGISPPVNPSPAVPSALPPGYVALKGEQVTCSACGFYCFNLPSDLAENLTFGRAWSHDLTKEIDGATAFGFVMGTCPSCGTCEGFAQSALGKINVKYRGWL